MAGILLVFSEPGPAVPEAEFNEWYDDEHLPLRIPIPAFHSWTRWAAVDGQKPVYFALYDLTTPDAVNEPPYSTLASTRSEREKSILARVALLDRRTYTAVPVPVPPRAAERGPYVVVVEIEIPQEHEEDFNRWYDEEHVALLAKAPQWVRTTRFVLKEGGAPTGTDESLRAKAGKPTKFLALHEVSDPAVLESEEFKTAISTEWSKRIFGNATVFERRLFKLYRAWERK